MKLIAQEVRAYNKSEDDFKRVRTRSVLLPCADRSDSV